MNTLFLLIAAFVLLPAITVVLWAWRTMWRAESALRASAGLQGTDFDIGTWPPSNRPSAT